MNDEKILNPTIKQVQIGYVNEETLEPFMVNIREITGIQMLKIVEVIEEATKKADTIGMEHFKMAQNNMELNQRLLSIGITHPKSNEDPVDYFQRINENLEQVKRSPQKHIDEACEIMLSMNDIQSFLAKNLLGVLQQIALQVSVIARKITEEEKQNLEKSMNSSQKNTSGPSGK